MASLPCSYCDRYDFTPVVEALAAYADGRDRPALRVSGWEVEDAVIAPPEALLCRLESLPTQPLGYACPQHFATAKSKTAAVLGERIHFAGAPPHAENITFTQNGTQALMLIFATLAEAGVERVVVAAPCYYAGVESARRLGLEIQVVPARDFLTG